MRLLLEGSSQMAQPQSPGARLLHTHLERPEQVAFKPARSELPSKGVTSSEGSEAKALAVPSPFSSGLLLLKKRTRQILENRCLKRTKGDQT